MKHNLSGDSDQERQQPRRIIHWDYRELVQDEIGKHLNKQTKKQKQKLSSFKDEKKKYDTELSKYVWALKKNDIEYNINWNIVQQCPSYTNANKRCPLCIVQQIDLLYCGKTKKPPSTSGQRSSQPVVIH